MRLAIEESGGGFIAHRLREIGIARGALFHRCPEIACEKHVRNFLTLLSLVNRGHRIQVGTRRSISYVSTLSAAS